jgi:hypothetical protein
MSGKNALGTSMWSHFSLTAEPGYLQSCAPMKLKAQSKCRWCAMGLQVNILENCVRQVEMDQMECQLEGAMDWASVGWGHIGQITWNSHVTLVQTWNPSYSASRNQEDQGSSPACARYKWNPISSNKTVLVVHAFFPSYKWGYRYEDNPEVSPRQIVKNLPEK